MELVLDKTDLQILDLMQSNARISNADLARELGMAPSAVLERVKKLEQKQVILQYNTQLNAQALNLKLLAFILLKTSDTMGCTTAGAELAQIPEVQEVHNIAGEDCFLIKVRVADSAALMSLMRNSMAHIKGVISTRTTIVLETVKEQTQLVIPKT